MYYFLSLALLLPTSVSAQEVYSINVNKLCANVVGIPYASDNFTDQEWNKFQKCVKIIKEYEVR